MFMGLYPPVLMTDHDLFQPRPVGPLCCNLHVVDQLEILVNLWLYCQDIKALKPLHIQKDKRHISQKPNFWHIG